MTGKSRVAVLTTGRQDWFLLRPVVAQMAESTTCEPVLVAGGMHRRDGVPPVVLDGVPVAASVGGLPVGEGELPVAICTGEVVIAVAKALHHLAVDALLVLGDRTETLAAAMAATCLCLPIVHLHGGEETTGAIDNACRHAISKLAHLHCVAHPRYAERLLAMGEEPWRVVCTGAPGLDLLLNTTLPDRGAIESFLGTALRDPVVLVTYHPTTLGALKPVDEIAEVMDGICTAMESQAGTILVTRANVDAGGEAINRMVARRAARDSRIVMTGDLGAERYWGIMAIAAVVVGNSSSGLLEAPSFGLTTINIGDRQGGRLRIHRVCDVPCASREIAEAVKANLQAPERPRVPKPSAFGDGQASRRMVAAIEAFLSKPARDRLIKAMR